jgi:hypothetical protein
MTEPWQSPSKTGYMQCDLCKRVAAPLYCLVQKYIGKMLEVCTECRHKLISSGDWGDDND